MSRLVPAWDVDREWARLAPLVEKPLKLQTALNPDAVRAELLNGRMHLWDGGSVALVTQIQTFACERICVIVLAGGSGLVGRRNSALRESLLAEIERYAKAHGCSALQIVGRKGWLRYGFDSTHEVVMRRKL